MNASPERFHLPWPNLFSLLSVAAMALVWWAPPNDLDFCWQIRTGQRILATGELRQPDRFSYTIAGKELPDHEWLYEVALAAIWDHFGHGGLKLLRLTFFVAPVAILAWQLRGRNVPRHAIALIALFSLFVLHYFERLRPLVCSTIGLQLVSGWLHDHCHGKRPLNWKLPLTMLLWANLHPAVIMGQALILGAIAWHVASAVFRPPADKRRRQAGLLALWGGLGLAATLVSPAPLDRFLYPFSPELRHPVQQMFAEIKSPFQHLGQPPFVVEMTLLLSAAYFLVLLLRRRELFGWEWALFGAVGILFLTAIRSTGDFLMIASALAVPQFGLLLLEVAKSPRWRSAARPFIQFACGFKLIANSPVFRLQTIWPAVAFAVFAALSLWPWGDRAPNAERADWPREAADWIAAGGFSGPGPWKVFSGFNEGSYLIWRFDGRVLVHSDTRGFYYPGQFLDDSYSLPRAPANWLALLDHVLRYGPEYFLLQVRGSDGKPFGFWQMLEPYIPNPLYRDDKYVILSTAQVRDAASAIVAAEK